MKKRRFLVVLLFTLFVYCISWVSAEPLRANIGMVTNPPYISMKESPIFAETDFSCFVAIQKEKTLIKDEKEPKKEKSQESKSSSKGDSNKSPTPKESKDPKQNQSTDPKGNSTPPKNEKDQKPLEKNKKEEIKKSPAKIVPLELTELKVAEEHFQILFPLKPRMKKGLINGQPRLKYQAATTDGAVSVTVFHGANFAELKGEKLKERFDMVRTDLLADWYFSAKINSEKDIKLDNKYEGREIKATLKVREAKSGTKPEASFHSRMYRIENKLFIISLLGKSEFVESESAQKLLNSFQYLPAK